MIPDELIYQGNWIKISGGFINPNLPSLFLFSSIFGYFLINKRNKVISQPNITGELIYKGKNVSLGYSENLIQQHLH